MKAMLTGPDRSLLWTDVPDPDLQDDEVLVKVHAAGVNRADLMQRNGEYPSPEGWPEWMGLEVAGVVERLGAEADQNAPYRVGDRVCALLGGGGYAEQVAVPYDLLMPLPEGFTLEEAAAVPETYATAYLNLFLEGGLQPGETVLIHAGASGVGIAASQLAKAFGARVIATVRSENKAAALRTHGVDVVVNSRQEDVRGLFDSYPVDVVLDPVGGSLMGECFAKLAPHGRWIVIATLGGDTTEIDLRTLYRKRLRLVGSTLRNRTREEKAALLGNLVEFVFPHFEQGSLRPVLYRVLPVSEAEAAHEILERNENLGKVILTIPSDQS
ncbi:MAG: NAD(P)H-quinone oxidoreductase [candidate division WS1 bacterium]|nr:NAD(P)H-quinone oxidoreductase [candidate division WS1 bacterium]